jgi:proteic killer suppression protein
MAIKTFADDTTSDIYHGINSKAARRIPERVWNAARRKMDLLNAAKDTRDLSLPGAHFEPLKHDRPGFNSIRVNDQYRIVFRFVKVEGQPQGDAYDVKIEDFHGRKQT